MSKATLFWRTAFLIEDLLVLSKDRFCWLSFKACWVNLVKGFRVCWDILLGRRRGQSSQMMVPARIRTGPPGLEERKVGCFRTSTWLCTPCVLARGGSAVGREEMDWGHDVAAQDPHLFPSSKGACSVPGIMHFSRSALEQDHEIPAQREQFPLTQAGEVTHPSWWDILLQIPVDATLPTCDGLSVLGHNTLIGTEQDNGSLPPLPHLYGVGCLGQGPQSGIGGNRPYWLIIQAYRSPGQGFSDPAKVVLPGTNLICCFNIHFPFLSTLLLAGDKREGTSILGPVLLPSLAVGPPIIV